MLTRRRMLAMSVGTTAAILTASNQSVARSMPSAEEVLFDPAIPVFGNPKGDVTIVEYFDYQCGYCKQAHPGLLNVVKSDGNIRLVMKDWPIFGSASVYAARLALGASATREYREVVGTLMATRSRLDKRQVDSVLHRAGLDPVSLANGAEQQQSKISNILARNKAQARAFRFIGTPSFVVGTKVLKGFQNEKSLREAVAEARA
ncbi:MAG: DsbA family protein [Phyllobacterium sp.]